MNPRMVVNAKPQAAIRTALPPRPSISARVRFSVTATLKQSRQLPDTTARVQARRDSPPRAVAAAAPARRPDCCSVNSLKNGRSKAQPQARYLRQLLGGVVGLAQAQLGRLLQPLRPERGQVDRRPQGQQALVGADVARRLLAADVLLARLQRQHPAALAVAIDRLADQPARHLAHKLLAAGQQAQVRPAVAHRRAQALPLGHGDVGPVLPRPLQQTQADRVEADDEQRTPRMGDVGQRLDSSRQPKKLGCCTTTQIVSSSTARFRSSGSRKPFGVGSVSTAHVEVGEVGGQRRGGIRDGRSRRRGPCRAWGGRSSP